VRFLLDEMFPARTAQLLRHGDDHTADHVAEVGLAGATDEEVAAHARAHDAAIVTENVADFAPMEELIVVFVRKRHLPAGGAQAAALAALLRRWAEEHPRPYLGHHWPT
jgi:predicted nuclease of predicted toxin-antitoxin system